MIFFLQDTVDIVGLFYGNELKIFLFLNTLFLFSTKNPYHRIFDPTSDFSKETHPNSDTKLADNAKSRRRASYIYCVTKNTTPSTKTSTLTVTLLNTVESIKRIVTATKSQYCSYKRSVTPFWFQLLKIVSSFIGTHTGSFLSSAYVNIQITVVPLITSYTNLSSRLPNLIHIPLQTLIQFTRTLLIF